MSSLAVLSFLFLMLPISVVAADPSNSTGNAGNSAEPMVEGACVYVDNKCIFEKNTAEKKVTLGQIIRVKVNNLPALKERQRAHCKDVTSCQEKKIHLFLNRMELKGVNPLFGPDDELQFKLLHRDELPEYRDNKGQKTLWTTLFGFGDTWKRKQTIDVSIGLEDGSPLKSDATLTLVRWSSKGLVVYCVVMGVILILYGAGYKQGLFSDRGIIEDSTPALSLARVQMAFWFFLVIAAFLFIWLAIGELPTIPVSILALIGIASGTTLGAAIIDSSKRASARAVVESEGKKQTAADNLKTSIETKIKERKQLETSIKELSSSDPGSLALIEVKKQQSTDLSRTIEQLQGELRTIKAQLPGLKEKSETARGQQTAVSSRTFLDDLFSDESGWSFHRVQMGVWTLVLGFVFVGEVMEYLAMPDFDTTLLALMGISSGTYLGFKLPEQQPASPAAT